MSAVDERGADAKPRSKTQQVYDYVMERIVNGEYSAGDLLNIGGIAEQTGVSLIPTREALRRLESEGLVEFQYHRGVRVTELPVSDYRDIMQTQAVLEALAVSQSAPLLTAGDLAQAREYNRLMDEAHRTGDFHAYNENSLRFHGLLSSRCPNAYLRDTLDRGHLRVAAVRAAVVGYRAQIARRLSDEHVDMLDRIAAGASPAEIERLMRDHREGTLAHDAEGLQKLQRGEEHPDPAA